MRFKDKLIKPFAVIHCTTEDDAEALLKHLDSLGYRWTSGLPLTDHSNFDRAKDSIYYQLCDDGTVGFYASEQKHSIEFSDLIEHDDSPINSDTDSPMSAAEVLEWLMKYHGKTEFKECFGQLYAMDILFRLFTTEEILNKITAYEAAKRESRPAELEWVNVCKIYQVSEDCGENLVMQTELKSGERKKPTENILKEAIAQLSLDKTSCYATVERRCRVKRGDYNEEKI